MATITYYFNAYDVGGEEWSDTPENMVDGSTATMTGWEGFELTQLLTTNTCAGTNLGTISKVELRAYGRLSSLPTAVTLRPVFNGIDDGDNHNNAVPLNEGWGSYQDITTDTNAPGSWSWANVQNLDCDVVAVPAGGSCKCGRVDIRVTYTADSDGGTGSGRIPQKGRPILKGRLFFKGRQPLRS